MQFTSGTVGQEILKEIEEAEAVDIVSAYFSPGEEEISVLESIPELRICVSKEFDVSDPQALEALHGVATVKCIPVDTDEGRLHAKVVSCRHPDGSKVAFVGSANFTGPGLLRNHEACVRLDTGEGDGRAIQDIKDWVDELEKAGIMPDWDHARSVHESSRRKRRTGVSGSLQDGSVSVKTPPPDSPPKRNALNFWVLKTRHGDTWADYWQKFKSEEIVAIGWEELTLNPAQSTKNEIRQQLDNVYSDDEVGRPARAAGLICRFVDQWEEGDLALLCRGFPGNHSGDVFFYGYARIEGDFFVDETDQQRKFKRPAAIQKVEIDLPKELYVQALDRGSMMETMHDLTEEQFYDFSNRVEKRYGISLRI